MKAFWKWLRRGLAALTVLIVIAGLALTFGWRPEPLAPQSQTAQWLQPGPLEVERLSYQLVDADRPTPANGDFPGSDFRSFDSDLYLPVTSDGDIPAGRYPAVLYLHGLASWKEGGRHFANYLASHGHIVLAADFPLSNFFAPGGPNPADVVNQAGDVSFLIDRLLAWDKDPDSPLRGHVDSDRIALLGYSLGGMTATLASFHPRWRDPRIAATVSIAGPSSMFGSRFYQHASLPFLMLAAEYDAMVPWEANASVLPQRYPQAQLVTLAKGSHIGFIVTAPLFRWMKNSDSAGCLVIRRVLTGADENDSLDWLDSLGGAEIGILPETSLPCASRELPRSMNPIRQHWLAKVVVRGFFQSQFAEDPDEREAAREFLQQILPREAPDVTWQSAQSSD